MQTPRTRHTPSPTSSACPHHSPVVKVGGGKGAGSTACRPVTQAGGALIGPHALGIIRDVEAVRHVAELGVVFLLFNIGLELSLERLQSMQKFVFGMGSVQVCGCLCRCVFLWLAWSALSDIVRAIGICYHFCLSFEFLRGVIIHKSWSGCRDVLK